MGTQKSVEITLAQTNDELEAAPSHNPITADADEFGRHVKAGGWRLGLLVARCVTPAQGTRSDLATGGDVPLKVSAAEFSRISDVGVSTVKYYYAAWELAAKAGMVRSADQLIPGQDDLADFDEDDERQEQWLAFYRQARAPKVTEKPQKKPIEKTTETKNKTEEKLSNRETKTPKVSDDEITWLSSKVDSYLESIREACAFADELVDRAIPITDPDVIEKIKVASDLAARFPFEVNDLIVE